MSRRHLGQASLGAITYCTSCHLNDECGADGLPLTPNSIRALGGFQKLKCLDHPTLCAYVDFIRCKHERIMVVSEHYSDNLSMAIKAGQLMTGEDLVQLAYEVLLGLDYLNQEGISHRSLSPKTVLFTEQGRVKLSNYGMYHMTDRGRAVLFPNGEPVYLAPEVLADGPATTRQSGQGSQQSQRTSSQSGYKVDVWSLGIILLEAYLGIRLWKTLTIQQIFHKLLSFLTTDIHPISIIEKDHGVEEKMKNLPEDLKSLVWLCLTVSPTTRPSPTQLLKHSVFDKVKKIKVPADCSFALATSALRCQNLELPVFTQNQKEIDEDRLGERSVEEIYYLWQLAGGDLEGLLWKAGLIRNHAPITKMASFVMGDGDMLGEEKDRSVLLDRTVVVLSQDQLRQRLEKVDPEAYYVLLENDTNGTNVNSSVSSRSAGEFNVTKQPLVIKEKDIEYQFHRIILYERLLKAYPYKRTHILREARVDIPPLYRAHVWAVLLDVEGHVQARYDAIDKMTPISTDRQIEVDIPRCHQYNELLSSHEGHAKLKRLLKAWVVSHPQYVYWQGLDSLSAPFLYLNFNNEALAYACLAKFIPKYLHKFFLKDNSRVIQEYLAVFSHLIAFHDPELSNHLDGIGFIPDLYAIPWFLTMYAHVFPLHKIFHLWDTLLLGNSSFPLYIGVAILYQLRDQLLSFGFNDCILLFSDMPEIDIQRCVTDSIRIFCSTPKSVTYRQHAIAPKKLEEQTSSQTFSYYTQDYNELPKTELSIDHISLEDLKAEKCARISAEDMIELGELQGQSNKRSPTKKTAQSKPNLLVIDVRSQEEFQRGSVTDSINIPFATAFGPEGDLLPCPAVQTLNKHKNQIKVVVGSHGKIAIHAHYWESHWTDYDCMIRESLVQQNYSKVCVLHNGIDALRNSAILTVPPADL